MKNEKGISLIVLIITIIVIIILAAITMYYSDDVIDDSINSKNEAQIVMDNEKIKEIMIYELAGTYELIDVEINLKRVELSDSLQIEYSGDTYGKGYALYLSEKDIDKVETATGSGDYFKPYKDLSKSYVVSFESGDYKRLEEEWKFKN